MSDYFYIGQQKLVPLKDVSKLVPYSRDYVARLAREGKVAAAQVNRQWYIDAESLKNFFANAQIEVRARVEYVRELRKQELDLHEWWAAFQTTQQKRREFREQRVLGKTIIVVILGLFVGLVITQASVTPYQAVSVNSLAQLFTNSGAQLAALWSTQDDSKNNHQDQSAATLLPGWSTNNVVEVDESTWRTTEGILLLPQGRDIDAAEAGQLFSDPVTIESVSPTEGVIHSQHTSSSIPFVKVPINKQNQPPASDHPANSES